MPSTWRGTLVLVVAGLAGLGACGGDPGRGEPDPSGLAPSTVPTTTVTTAATTTVVTTSTLAPPTTLDPRLTVVAEAVGDTVAVYDAADATEASRVLARADEVSGTLVFVVEEEVGDRLLVQLPVRPNGSTGWIDRRDVTLSEHGYRIEVELGAHRLRLWHLDDLVMDTVIGVGTQDTPTPGGTFYLKELLQPPDPTAVYGPYAYGLSGFSTVYESFAGGAGVIGLHGTNRPELLGTDVSHGCIRLHNDDIVRLVEEIGLPLGTPVAILP